MDGLTALGSFHAKSIGLGQLGLTKVSFVRCWRYVLYLHDENEFISCTQMQKLPNVEGNCFTVKFLDNFPNNKISSGKLELWIATASEVNHTQDMSKLENVLKSGLSSIKSVKNWYCLERWKFDSLKLKENKDSSYVFEYSDADYESLTFRDSRESL